MDMGPLRSADYVQYCREEGCDAVARTRCVRCQLPLCADHTPPRDERCQNCETEFTELVARASERRSTQRGWLLAALGLRWLVRTLKWGVSGGAIAALIGVLADFDRGCQHFEATPRGALVGAIVSAAIGAVVALITFVPRHQSPPTVESLFPSVRTRRIRRMRTEFLEQRSGQNEPL